MNEKSDIPGPTLPGGTVTFLFTDIQGSTQLLNRLRDQYTRLLADHHKIIRDALERWHGREVDTQGDAFFAAFPKATGAVAAVAHIQRTLAGHQWPEGVQVRVRMGLHTGEPWLVEEGYVGMDVHRAARIGHAGHGGQVLLSETTAALVRDELPEDVSLVNLGRHRFKDMRRPKAIYQLTIEGLPADFPPLKSLEALPTERVDRPEAEAGAPRKVGPSPYRGLAAFRESDAALFFGREAFTDQLSAAVGQRGLVAVIVGPSGSGKSSAVFAGLLPQLRASGEWLIVETRPGGAPFQALASGLYPVLEDSQDETDRLIGAQKLAQAMRDGELSLFNIVRRALARHEDARRLLLVIDQFEEIFTQRPDPEEQRFFLDELLSAAEMGAAQRRSPLVLLLTLRADFMGQALAHRPFADALQEGSLLLGPMNREELQAAVEKPAELQGAAFEPGLIQRILDDVGQEPGNLPLLEFALTLLWERLENGWMTHAAYEEIGRVDGALARYAEEVWDGLDGEERRAARPLFVQLVQPGEGTEDTRRVARRTELAPGQWSLVQHLADRRLVVTSRDEAGEETAEVVHEALIRGWDRLKRWMMEDRAFRTWQEGLRVAQRGWQASGRDEGALLRGAPLALALEWAEEGGRALSPTEMEYIEASRLAREKRRAAEEERRQREVDTARKLAETEHARAEEQSLAARGLRRRAYILGGVLVVAAVLAVAALFFARQSNENARVAETNASLAATRETEALAETNARATAQAEAEAERGRADEQRDAALAAQDQAVAEAEFRATAEAVAITEREIADEQRQAAEEQALIAFSRELAAAALNNLENDPERGILLAMEGLSAQHTLEAESALHQALQSLRLRGALYHGLPSYWAAFSPDGTQLFVSGAGGGSLWDLTTRELLYKKSVPEGDWINHADFSPDGTLLVMPGETWDGNNPVTSPVTILDISRGEVLVEFPAHEGYIQSVAFNPDGTLFATTSPADSSVKVWDLAGTLADGAGRLVYDFCCAETGSYLAFSPDGRRLLAKQGGLKVFDVTLGEELFTLDTQPNTMVFSPDGRYLVNSTGASSSYLGRIEVRDVATGELLSSTIAHNGNSIGGVAFSPDGSQLVSYTNDAMVALWQFSPDQLQKVMDISGTGAGAGGVFFSPDGRYLTVAGMDGVTRVWDISPAGQAEVALVTGPEEMGRFVITHGFLPGGLEMITSGADGTLRVWDTTTWEELLSQPAIEMTIEEIDVSPDGRFVATAIAQDGLALAQIWDAQSWQLLHVLEGHTWQEDGFFRGVTDVEFSPDNRWLATAGGDELAIIWDVATGNQLVAMTGHGDDIVDLDFSPDGRLLATASRDRSARVWDAFTGQLLATMTAEAEYWAVDFSPDGEQLASGRTDGLVEIWKLPVDLRMASSDASSEGVELALEFQTAATWISPGSTRFSPDGQRIATAGTSGIVEIHDADTGETLLSLPHPVSVNTVGFTPDGKGLITIGQGDGILRVFALDLDDLIALARSRVTRSLTDEECRQYLHLEACPER